MRILLADDQAEVRASLRLLLEASNEHAGWTIVGETTNARDLLAQARALEPDVVLLDWELPSPGAADALPVPTAPFVVLAALRVICPAAKLVALSARPEARAEAQRAGVDAFVTKGEGAALVLAALRNIYCDPGD